MTSYIFDNAAERDTEQRFFSLESLYDPLTTRHLAATGIGSGWICWEIGGGSGSIGLWLSERIGPEGHAMVTGPFVDSPSVTAARDLVRASARHSMRGVLAELL